MVNGSPGNFEVLDHPDPAQAPAAVLDAYNQHYGIGLINVVDENTLVYSWEEIKIRDGAGKLVRRVGAFTDTFKIIKAGRRAANKHVAYNATELVFGTSDLEL